MPLVQIMYKSFTDLPKFATQHSAWMYTPHNSSVTRNQNQLKMQSSTIPFSLYCRRSPFSLYCRCSPCFMIIMIMKDGGIMIWEDYCSYSSNCIVFPSWLSACLYSIYWFNYFLGGIIILFIYSIIFRGESLHRKIDLNFGGTVVAAYC